jgi:hypothetical protein
MGAEIATTSQQDVFVHAIRIGCLATGGRAILGAAPALLFLPARAKATNGSSLEVAFRHQTVGSQKGSLLALPDWPIREGTRGPTGACSGEVIVSWQTSEGRMKGAGMFTFRNVLAIGVFLFGTTFLWLTAAFNGGERLTGARLWKVIQALALAAVIGFAVAAWGIFKTTGWWEPIAIASAIVGMASVLPYWVAIHRTPQSLNTTALENVAIHFLGGAVVVTALLVPALEQWITGRM